MSDVFKFVCMSYNDIFVESERYNIFLHKAELEKIKKAVDKRRLEFLFGRLCAKEAYAKLYYPEIDFKELCILNDCFGAPYFENKSCLVSITHDAGLVLQLRMIETFCM